MKEFRDIFSGPFDECERIIGCLQYCSFLPVSLRSDHVSDLESEDSENVLGYFEKGILYKGMISNLQEFSLLDQNYYIIEKFTEFRERVEMADIEIQIIESDFDQLLMSILQRLKSLAEHQLESAFMVKAFYLVKLQPDIFLVFHVQDSEERECALFVVSQDVAVFPARLASTPHLLDLLSRYLHYRRRTQDQALLHTASLVCLVRDFSTLRPAPAPAHPADLLAEEEADLFDSRQLYDEHILAMYEILQQSKKAEAVQSIQALRYSLSELVGEVAQGLPRPDRETEEEAAEQSQPIDSSLLAEVLADDPRSPGEHSPEPLALPAPSPPATAGEAVEGVSTLSPQRTIFSFRPQPAAPAHLPELPAAPPSPQPQRSPLPAPPALPAQKSQTSLAVHPAAPSPEEVRPPQPAQESPLKAVAAQLAGAAGRGPSDQLTASLYSNLLASQESEDVAQYVRRAYGAIRDRFLDEALAGNLAATQTLGDSQALDLPPPPAASSEPLPVPAQQQVEADPLAELLTASQRLDDEDGRAAFLQLVAKHADLLAQPARSPAPAPPVVASRPATAPALVPSQPSQPATALALEVETSEEEPTNGPDSLAPTTRENCVPTTAQPSPANPAEAAHVSPAPNPSPAPSREQREAEVAEMRRSFFELPLLSPRLQSPKGAAYLEAGRTSLQEPEPAALLPPPSVGAGRRVRQQVVLDQLRAAQSAVECDYLQHRIERNQRRVRIGQTALQLLRQQRLFPMPLPSPMAPLVSQPATRPPSLEGDRGPPRSSEHPRPTVSPKNGRISEFQPQSRRSQGEAFFFADPADGQRIASFDEIDVLAAPRSVGTAPKRSPGGPSELSQPSGPPVSGGLVWDIDTGEGRPKSRIKAAVLQRPTKRDSDLPALKDKAPSPVKEPIAVPTKPPQYSPRKLPQPAAQAPEEAAEEPRKERAASANRAARPTSRSAVRPVTKTLSNFTQVRNAINYVCLAGAHQEEKRGEVLALLDYYHQGREAPEVPPPDSFFHTEFKGQVAQFVLMFYKAKNLAFKAVYLLDGHSKKLLKIFGKGGPMSLGEADPLIREFLKFDSSSKSFKPIPTKAVSSTIDAVILEPPKSKNLPL